MTRVLAAAALATLLLAACGKAEQEKPPAPAAPPPAQPQQPAAPAQGAATAPVTSVGAEAAKVKTPAYAPIYPGAVVSESTVGESGVGKGGMVSFRASDPPADVIAFYDSKAKAAGVPVTMNAEMGAQVMMFTAGDTGAGKNAVQVIASPAGNGSEVQLTWSEGGG